MAESTDYSHEARLASGLTEIDVFDLNLDEQSAPSAKTRFHPKIWRTEKRPYVAVRRLSFLVAIRSASPVSSSSFFAAQHVLSVASISQLFCDAIRDVHFSASLILFLKQEDNFGLDVIKNGVARKDSEVLSYGKSRMRRCHAQ